MVRPRNQAERRAQLIDATARTVVDLGAPATKLRDVARAAGVTPASVLYYYADIHELFAAVFERSAATYFVTRSEAIADAEGPTARLRACIHSGVPWPGQAEESTRLLFELFPVALRNESAAERHRLFADQQAGLYRDVLESGQASGDFALAGDADALGRSFVALEDGYAMDLLIGIVDPREIENRLLDHARLVTANPVFRRTS
ncbi:TetR/AcrR family transcriptional regulator [Actinacidiphila acidipaludis]|uniref:TetR/AcrR family transcriptional regulator n=1 Tax=Actinacidiphila acidipaludis TaxID=2873382 RepID=A0ABS7Q5M5_9ACTN|nr:TetR/AcrR family transcriptional regulator [Streptomyces acidipaludis]MBY8878268.1 TetR/AcrR family transcriptional regulator [Streptomyces acidipaludis]